MAQCSKERKLEITLIFKKQNLDYSDLGKFRSQQGWSARHSAFQDQGLLSSRTMSALRQPVCHHRRSLDGCSTLSIKSSFTEGNTAQAVPEA